MRRLVLAIVLAAAAPAAADEPAPQREQKVETFGGRPSGFWGSTRPAQGGAYRWRLLGIGVVLAAATGYLMLRLVKRANAERASRERPLQLATGPAHTARVADDATRSRDA